MDCLQQKSTSCNLLAKVISPQGENAITSIESLQRALREVSKN